jgi:hypothetical protein
LVQAHSDIFAAVSDSSWSGYAAPGDILLHTPEQIEVLLR